MVKNLPINGGDARDVVLIPGWGRSPRVGNGNLLQYSCLENSMDRGAWQGIVRGITRSQIGLSMQTSPKSFSEVAQLCPTLCNPWTVAHQAPPSMGFSRQEYWSGLPFPSPEL